MKYEGGIINGKQFEVIRNDKVEKYKAEGWKEVKK